MSNPEIPIVDPKLESTPQVVTDPDAVLVNPFLGSQPIERQPSRLSLGGGNILSQAGVLLPPNSAEPRKDGEQYNDVQEAAKIAGNAIAEMLITNASPDSIVFPVCHDIDVIPQLLKQLEHTVLSLGYGPFPESVSQAWARFMSETTKNYRTYNGLETADLVPLKIEMPKWLNGNPSFDILPNCKLMDIEIDGEINSVIAESAEYCRITFNGIVGQGAKVCNYSKRCTVVFQSNIYATNSFNAAENMSIRILGNQQGALGTMIMSRVECSGNFNGYFNYRGQGSSWGQGVRVNQA